MRRLLPLASFLSGCISPTAPPLPPGAELFAPPSVYKEWWNLTEECSGLSGDFARIAWYRVPAADAIPLGDGTMVQGFWEPAAGRIVLAGASQGYGDLVRHEMLHALLNSVGHPRDAFIGRCGETVTCAARCIREGGPAPQPDPAARAIAPTALQIGVELIPSQPSYTVNDGNFRMVVTARNGSAGPVIVQLPPSGDAGASLSFSYEIVGNGARKEYNVRADVPEVTRFAAYEMKRYIFDFHIGSGGTRYDLPPGTFQFKGAYGEVWAPNPPTVSVAP